MAKQLLSITKVYSYDTIENAEKHIEEMYASGYDTEWVDWNFRVDDYKGEHESYICYLGVFGEFDYSVKYFK